MSTPAFGAIRIWVGRLVTPTVVSRVQTQLRVTPPRLWARTRTGAVMALACWVGTAFVKQAEHWQCGRAIPRLRGVDAILIGSPVVAVGVQHTRAIGRDGRAGQTRVANELVPR